MSVPESSATRLPEPPAPSSSDTPRSSGKPALVWVVLGLGIIMFLVGNSGGSYNGKLNEVLKQDNTAFLPESAQSTRVADEAGKFSDTQSIPGFVVYQRDGGLTDADKQKIQGDIAKLRKLPGVSVNEIGGAPQISKSGEVAAVAVPLVTKINGKDVKFENLGTYEKKILDTAREGAPSGLVVKEAGAAGLIAAFSEAFDGLDTNLLYSAGIVVIIILLFVYRSPVLWFVPLFNAFLALGSASILIYYLAKNEVITLDGQSQGILSVLVIGAGTDYALLFISRYREELHEFASPVDAVVAAWKGTVAPIGASAITVILGLICLTFADLKSTASLGPVCAIGIAATVLTMLTVLPLTLLFFGRFIHWLWPVGWVLLALNFRKRRMLDGRWLFWPKKPRLDHNTDIIAVHGVWGRFSEWLSRHSRRSWVGAAVVLIACVAAISTLRTDGLNTKDSFTGKPDAIKGQEIYDANFDQGAGAPAQILAKDSSRDDVIAAAKKVSGVRGASVCVATNFGAVADKVKSGTPVTQLIGSNGCATDESVQVQPRGGDILINAPLTTSYDSAAAYDTIKRLREAVNPIDGTYVGGQSAATLDVQEASRSDRNLIIPIVLLVILVVLGVVLRALLAPLLLILTVVLSFLASLGVSAVFFNHVFDYANADPGFPLFAFVFLVALGIDYNIFLMTRVREETVEHGTREGIVRGLAVTGGVITSAGVVLAATFVVLGIVPIVFLAQIGFTVAFGVLLDTIIVRSVLVPALGIDIGKKIWWPSRLAAADAKD